MSLPFRVERRNDAVVVRLEPTGAEWTQRFLLRSDAHWDNPHCNSDLELKHLKQAVECNAGILDFGDLFDVMQGKHDKRSNKGALRSDVSTSAYLDTLVEKAVERYKPFAKHWVLMAEGNHETKVRDHSETDMTQRLVAALNVTTGSHIQAGKYKGWVRFAFQRDRAQHSRRLWYIHGYGGGGPVTLDMIQRQRQLVYVDGADIMVSGHTHDQWYQITEKEGIDQRDSLYRRSVHYLKLGCYKDDYAAGTGWHIESGKPPKPLGAWWLIFGYSQRAGPTMRFERAD